MLWTKLLLLLLFSLALASSSSPMFSPEEDIFEKIINVASSYHLVVKLYLEQFFRSIGFERGSADWSFVVELLEVLRGEGGADGGEKNSMDSIERMLYYGLKPNVTIPPAIQNKSVTCKLCLGLIAGLRIAIKKTNYTFIEEQSIKICKFALSFGNLRANELCNGTIKVLGPHINYIVTQPIFMIPKICPYMNACTSSEEPATLKYLEDAPGNSNEETEESKPEVLVNESEERSVIKIVQLTDIHIEKRYKNGTATYCGLPVCCIEKWGKGEAGHFGDYKCNIPEVTVKNFLRKVKDINPDAILFTGDVSPHTVWEETFESQMSCTETAAKLFEESLPGKSIYPIIGNHETYPTNLFSVGELKETKDFLDVFKEAWKKAANFNSDDLKNIDKGGFYTKLIREGLRVIAFNSAYMFTSNIYNVINHEKKIRPEAKNTHKFLESSLKSAADKNEKVILAFHHPPGGSEFIISQSVWLEKLMLTYSKTIVLTVNGHTHTDEFRLVYDKNGKPVSVILVAPSVNTGGNINPSMRVFHLDGKTFQVLNYEQYFLDINKLSSIRNIDYDISDSIKKSYAAKEEYALPDLSPSSWHDLTVRMEKERPLLLKYLNHYSSNAVKVDDAGAVTQRIHLCKLRNIHHDRVKACIIENDFLPTKKPSFHGV